MPTRLKVRYALFVLCGLLWGPVFYKFNNGTWQSYATLSIAWTAVSTFLMLVITRLTRVKQ